MKLNTPSERFFVFMAITMLFGVGYQHYFNYQTNKVINQEIERHNVLVGKYTFRNYQLSKENTRLQRDLLHAESENMSLVEQLDHVANHYQVEVIKLKSQIVKLTYGEKNERDD